MILRQPKTPQILLLILYLVPETYILLCGGKYSYFGGWISVRGTAESFGSKAATYAEGNCLS